MSATASFNSPVVVVTGANGFVGARTCATLLQRGAIVRAIVRRAGSAPSQPGVEEHVGDFYDPALANAVVHGATAVITTVHPMGANRETQERIAVEGTPTFARAARDAGVRLMAHISTAAVYHRSPDTGDVDETSALVDDDAGAYATTKRDTDVALAEVDGITRVLLRPPAILGPGPTSVWNTRQPAAVRNDEHARQATPRQTFAWVHVEDLARLAADLATGRVPSSPDPELGPVAGDCTAVNVAAPDATVRDYHETVTGALGVEPVWDDKPAWTGRFLAERAQRWGWTPAIDLSMALQELRDGLTAT